MVGVCIKYMHENYGGMLQAYTTTRYLEKMGIDYELIFYTRKKTCIEAIKDLPRLFNGVWLNSRYEGIQRRISLRLHPEYAHNNDVRMKEFARFKESAFTRLSDEHKGYRALCRAGCKYSAVLTGSDQLWSPAGLPTNYYNLMFVPDLIRKISWASSFGVGQIPWYQKKRTQKYLNRIEYISMRENRGAEIVKELTGKEVPVLMDPVFVFDQAEWDQMVEWHEPEWRDYIFCYFLGNNQEHRKAANELSQKTGMKIVTLRHLDRYVAADEHFGDYAPYDVGPDRFLNILRNAKYICTDSFHGAAFSIIYEKQFIVFNRYSDVSKNSKNSRIESLCANLGLMNRRFVAEVDIIIQMQRKIDYTSVKSKLEVYQEKTKAYLREALSFEC